MQVYNYDHENCVFHYELAGDYDGDEKVNLKQEDFITDEELEELISQRELTIEFDRTPIDFDLNSVPF